MASESAEAVRSGPGRQCAQEQHPGPAALPGDPADLAAIDRAFQAWRARLSGGVSPVGFWLAYLDWLARGSGGRAAPPAMGGPGRGYPPLDDAPGTYVLQW